jgi:hypothetical protein
MTADERFLIETCQSLNDMDADFRPSDVQDFLSRNPKLRDADEAATEFCRAAAAYEYPDTHPGR